VARVDLSGPTVLSSFRVGNRPDDIIFNASGSRAYVTNLNDQTVGVIQTATSTQTATYTVVAHPIRLLLGPGEGMLYVTLDNGTVAVLDATTGALATTLAVGGTPNGIALSPDAARVYVSTYAPGGVAEINTASNAVIRTIAAAGTPQDLVVSRDGSTLYMANEGGWLEVRTIATGALTDSIPVPGAFGLALTPDEAAIWVTQTASGAVAIIDRATRKLTRTVYTLGAPRHLAFPPDGSVALVANESGYVQLIR